MAQMIQHSGIQALDTIFDRHGSGACRIRFSQAYLGSRRVFGTVPV